MSDEPRYKVLPPAGTDEWWSIIDTHSHLYWGEDNFTVGTISTRVKKSELLIKEECDRFNQEDMWDRIDLDSKKEKK